MMPHRRKGWIGIDLGSRALKLVQMERVGTRMRVAASVVVPRPPALRNEQAPGAGGDDWSGQEIAAALSLHRGFSGRRVACVLPMRFTDVHVLNIPPGRHGEQRAMVRHELSNILADEKQDRQFDYWNTDLPARQDSPSKATVCVLSVPRERVSRVVRDLARAKCSCEVMDGLPLVLARALRLTYPPRLKAPMAAVDWGFTSATFCVVFDKNPLYTRHLRSCGMGRLVHAVSQALSLSEDEAVQLLTAHGLPDPDRQDGQRREVQEVIAEVATCQLNEMAEELNRTISYLQTQYPAAVPDRLCLLGGGATIRNVAPLLSRKVGLPVDVWRLPHPEDENGHGSQDPPELVGPAVALSALAWVS